ncbi:Hypothetical protein NTJ_15257 [Nesidiocoris tenuis]|uniref:Uncharacterized protein n=1 Tax=Nesidiocoris tenuis TaxID=355587 RepID=A0ABN7BFF6_9HEMI|nr:Hypothetical protein NTJ_15257 [Nesidiocoris tenuis]
MSNPGGPLVEVVQEASWSCCSPQQLQELPFHRSVQKRLSQILGCGTSEAFTGMSNPGGSLVEVVQKASWPRCPPRIVSSIFPEASIPNPGLRHFRGLHGHV